MKRYLLDTNTLSHLIKSHPKVAQRITAVPMAALCISAISEAELLFGLAKRPEAKRLHQAVHELLIRLDVLPFNGEITPVYGKVRAELESQGKTLAPLDLLIASHALGAGAVLVTSDKAFSQVADLTIEDWTE
jgi:tRNA(fMet)-specific endonuclease VapC